MHSKDTLENRALHLVLRLKRKGLDYANEETMSSKAFGEVYGGYIRDLQDKFFGEDLALIQILRTIGAGPTEAEGAQIIDMFMQRLDDAFEVLETGDPQECEEAAAASDRVQEFVRTFAESTND